MIIGSTNNFPIYLVPMDKWQQFLTDKGAHFGDAPMSDVRHFGVDAAPADMASGGFVAPLTDLGLLALTGEEAAHFLHSQLTNDVEHLGPTEARLAGYCSPKGRLLATFLMWRSMDTIVLQLPRTILPAIQKRLQMFVLRAKVKIVDVSTDYAVLGLAGQAVAEALHPWFAELPQAPYAKSEHPDAGTLIRLPDAAGAPRYQWIAAADYAIAAWPQLTQTLRPQGGSAWRLTNIQAGVPQVVQATQEQFVPQMINYEALGGVNFKKGCYPGQEIVARSQYLGKLKRRMALATLEAETVASGMEVFSSADPEQPCGMIVNAEAITKGQYAALVELKTAALETGTIHLGTASGPVLHFAPLPYALPDAA